MKLSRKLPLAILASVLLALTFLAGCNNETTTDEIKPPQWVEDQVYELTLLHTNDSHGQIMTSAANYGLAERATYIKAEKAANANVLLVDAGDINTGTMYSNYFDAEPDIKAYNLMGYDAATFGNHEFDGNMAKLQSQIAMSNFAWVSSNIKTSSGKFLGGHQYLVKNYNGFRVGILGLTTTLTTSLASPDSSLTFLNEIQAAQTAVDLLRNKEKAGVIIALTHMGDVKLTPDYIIAEALAEAVTGIDIIVDGHSHSSPAGYPKTVGTTTIVTAASTGQYVGTGTLSIKNGALNDFSWSAEVPNGSPDTAMQALLQPYIDEVDPIFAEVVGYISADFDFGGTPAAHRSQETAIGNLITDAYMWYAKEELGLNDIDFAFMNGGGIRANFLYGTTGAITLGNVYTTLAFDNFLFVVEMKGDKLKTLFDFMGTIALGGGGFPQISRNVTITIDKTKSDGNEITELKINNANLDPARTYKIMVPDFLLTGGDNYPTHLANNPDMIQNYTPYNTILRDALVAYFKAESSASKRFDPSTLKDGHMTVIPPAP